MNTKKKASTKRKNNTPATRRLFAVLLSILALYISTNIYLSVVITLCALYNMLYLMKYFIAKYNNRKKMELDKDMLFVYAVFLTTEILFCLSIFASVGNPLWLIFTLGTCLANMMSVRWLLKNKRDDLIKMQKSIEGVIRTWASNSIYRE